MMKTMTMKTGKMKMNNKKIVVFGPDNSGKTTLSKQISSVLDFEYSHSPGPVPIEKMLEYMEENLNKKENVVFDRFPIIEEKTCGKVLRGFNKFDPVGEEEVSRFLSKIDLFIYCNPKAEIIKNWQEREQMEGVKENIISLIYAYDKLNFELIKSNYPVIRYDWTTGEDIIKKIEGILI